MTDTEAQPVSLVETPHALDSIKPDAWVNIPRCITDAFQLIVSQIKSTQNQMLTINETVTKSHEQLETEFKSFVQASNISEREIAKLIDGFRDTLNRTLKNFSLEVSVISEMALENQQKVQQLQEQTKSLKKGLGSLEDNGLQKIIKDITDELSLKFDIKEANLKDYVGNKIYEMIDIPGLVGPGKKFNNIKSLIKHIHDAYDSRADAITQVIDNRDAFLKKALTDYDLPSKIKTVVHTEIRQHVMPEIEKMDMTLTKYEDKQKQSINESALLARIQSLEQQSKALEDKLHRMQILHEGFAMSPRVVEQTEENKETIGSKDSIVDVEVRIRSKSDSREMSRGLNFDAHSKNKLSRNVLWKDESGSRLIEEEDEDVMSPQVKGHKAIGFDQDLELEKRTSEATEKGKESQLVSDILKEKSAPINDTGSMYSSNVSSSSHGGKSPMRAIKPSLVQKGKPKRSNTITLESNNNTKTHFKSTKATDESFTTEGNTSLRKDGSPHRAHILDQSSMMSKTGHSFGGKAQIFDPAKFDIKQMGPHTFEFLSILEHEFDAIYNLLGDLYHQHDHNKTPTHINHRQTTARSGAGPGTGRGTSMDNRELPPPKVSPPKSTSAKVSAYQLLKALTKHGEEHAPPKEKGPSQQEILSRPPLIQIRPQGVQVAAVQPPSQGQPHLPQLPQRARIGSDQLAHDAKELMEAHGHGRMSPLKMRATQGNGKWGVGMVQPVKDVSRLTGDSSFEMTKEILDNEREDGVFVPYPTEKTMQEIPIVRQRAVTDKFSRDNGERMYS